MESRNYSYNRLPIIHKTQIYTELKIAQGSKLQRPQKCTEVKIATELKIHQAELF